MGPEVDHREGHADRHADEHVAADDRIAHAARQQPRPPDEHRRPAPAEKRLEREVYDVQRAAEKQRECRARDEPDPLGRDAVDVRREQPDCHHQRDREHRETLAAARIRAARPEIAPRQRERDQEQDENQNHLAWRRAVVRQVKRHVACRHRPRADEREIHELAAISRGLEPDFRVRTGEQAFPRLPDVRVRAWRPFRRDLVERRRIESRGRDRRRPIHRLRRRIGSGLDLRRLGDEPQEPTGGVEIDQGHPGHDKRRITAIGRVAGLERNEHARTGAPPEVQRGRPRAREDPPTICAGAVLSRPIQIATRVVESDRLIDGGIGIAERLPELFGAIRQYFRWLVDGRAVEHRYPRRDRQRDAQKDGDCRHPRKPLAARERDILAAGRGHHLGRRRLARSERSRERIAAGQGRRDRQRRRGTLGWIAIDAALNGALDRWIQSLHELGRRRDRSGLLLEELGHGPCGVRATAGEDLVEHQPERVDVALGRDLSAFELLGRHVGRRADADVADVANRRETEVHDADLARRVQHDVRRLEIAVDDAALVGGGETRGKLPRQLERPVFRKAADAFERRCEIFAVDVLHREVQIAFDLADVVDATDVGVRDVPRRSDFVVELREPARVGREVLGQKLQRHGLAQTQIVGAVDLAHPAAAEQAGHAVPAVEHGPRRESPVIDRARRAQPPAGGRSGARAARRRRRRRCETRVVLTHPCLGVRDIERRAARRAEACGLGIRRLTGRALQGPTHEFSRCTTRRSIGTAARARRDASSYSAWAGASCRTASERP